MYQAYSNITDYIKNGSLYNFIQLHCVNITLITKF